MIDPALLAPSAGPPFAFIVPFNVPFPGPPQNVTITFGQFGAPGVPAAGLVAVVHTILPGSFEIGFSGAPPAFLGFYWRANL